MHMCMCMCMCMCRCRHQHTFTFTSPCAYGRPTFYCIQACSPGAKKPVCEAIGSSLGIVWMLETTDFYGGSEDARKFAFKVSEYPSM